MPSHDEHREGAKVFAAVVAVLTAVGVYWYTQSLVYILIALIPVIVYPVFIGIPDVDVESSIPRRQLRTAVIGGSVLSAFGVVYFYWPTVSTIIVDYIDTATPDNSIVFASGIAIVGGLGAGVVADRQLSERLPNHRGILHNPGFYLSLGVPVMAIVDQLYLIHQHEFVRLAVHTTISSAVLFSIYHIGQDKLH